jgi:hypothetical protein
MAITSVAGVISGLRPPRYSIKSAGTNTLNSPAWLTSWYLSGVPAAATANTSGLAGQALTSSTAAPPFTNPESGNTYLARIDRAGLITSTGTYLGQTILMLVDRMWENSGLNRTLTTAQTVNSVTWPARDINGTTNGAGVYLAVEISTAMGTGTPTITVSYTNSAGTSGRTGTNIAAVTASSLAGVWYPIGLQAGDVGVRSVQSVTFSATWGTAGVLHLVAYRPICLMDNVRLGSFNSSEDAVTLAAPQLWDNTVLQPVHWTMDTSSQFGGRPITIIFTQG